MFYLSDCASNTCGTSTACLEQNSRREGTHPRAGSPDVRVDEIAEVARVDAVHVDKLHSEQIMVLLHRFLEN